MADIQPQNVQVTTDQVQSNFTQEEIMKQQTQDRPRELQAAAAAAERGPEEVRSSCVLSNSSSSSSSPWCCITPRSRSEW